MTDDDSTRQNGEHEQDGAEARCMRRTDGGIPDGTVGDVVWWLFQADQGPSLERNALRQISADLRLLGLAVHSGEVSGEDVCDFIGTIGTRAFVAAELGHRLAVAEGREE